MSFPCALVLWLLPGAGAQQLQAGPWVQQVESDSAWVLWWADDEGQVEWGDTAGLGQTVSGEAISGGIQQARLAPLEPGSRTWYRVSGGGGDSSTHSFTSASAGSESTVRFAVVSDTQHDGYNPDKWSELVHSGIVELLASEYSQDPDEALDFVLVSGDLVDNGWETDQWRDEFLAPAQELMAAVPFYPAIGNHEANSSWYFDLFRLPENGTEGYLEHWWSFDRGNLRVVGLDSNSPYTGAPQQDWLQSQLDEACGAESIDFLVAQLHHPWLSELWPPGESDFTGEVIELLDVFAVECGKPVVHFFGHTHGYARGESRDAPHLWVNAATAGGNIDYWLEYEQVDYEQFSRSQDEYGFVLVEATAGDEPTLRLRRYGRGDEYEPTGNTLRDQVLLRRAGHAPVTPEARSPVAATEPPRCLALVASPFCDPDGDSHASSHWQVAGSCDDFDEPLWEQWLQQENWYLELDLSAGEQLGDAVVSALSAQSEHCWRVRYRDSSLAWSEWSEPAVLSTGADPLADNLLVNPGGEQGTAGWELREGVLEAVTAGECEGGDPHSGQAYFAVGGVCEGVDYGEAVQALDLAGMDAAIDAGEVVASFGGWLATYGGSDLPQLELVFRDGSGASLGTSERLESQATSWSLVQGLVRLPAGTRGLDFTIMGTRNAGQDNDSYMDDLFLFLAQDGSLDACLEPPDYPYQDEAVSCEPEPDADSGGPVEDRQPANDRDCGCANLQHRSTGLAVLGLVVLVAISTAVRKSPPPLFARPRSESVEARVVGVRGQRRLIEGV